MAANGSVAVVDDEVDVIRTYELLFKSRKIHLSFTALDGPEAIEKFKNIDPRPSVVIIDYRLPSINGLDVVKAILGMEPKTKIIFISGDEGSRQAALDAGATMFMKKPTPIKEITEAVRSLL
jgi:CheY-like chemotaxis protein